MVRVLLSCGRSFNRYLGDGSASGCLESGELYGRLEIDFDLGRHTEVAWNSMPWAKMDYEFVTDDFKQRHMGVVLDNSEEISSVFTAVWPSDLVLSRVLGSETRGALVFTYLPMVWDIRAERAFTDINPELLPGLRERRVSLYSLHVPWAKHREYGPSPNLARALGVSIERAFADGVGVIGITDAETTGQFRENVSSILGHRTKLYEYGVREIAGRRLAVVGGHGCQVRIIREIVDLGIDTYVTGVTVRNVYTKEAHEIAERNGVNIIGGTSYSTEKFGCISACDYFRGLGLPSVFLEDEPVFEDL